MTAPQQTPPSRRRVPAAVDMPRAPSSTTWVLGPPASAATALAPQAPLAPPLTELERRALDVEHRDEELRRAWHTVRAHAPELREELETAVTVVVGAARRELRRWAKSALTDRAYALVAVAVAVGLIGGLRASR